MMSYLAGKIIQFYEDFDSFCKWIKAFEKTGTLKRVSVDRERRMVTIAGKINVGLYPKVDPINNLVLLGFAFFGEYWAFMPDTKEAFKKIKKWWREQIKNRNI